MVFGPAILGALLVQGVVRVHDGGDEIVRFVLVSPRREWDRPDKVPAVEGVVLDGIEPGPRPHIPEGK